MSLTKDWRKICTDCQEGEPPKDCEYFGEPGGCNAPTMGKHPTPLRNVDRFNTPDEALSAYSEDKGITQPLPLWYGNEFWAFIHWLFAEVKGGEK